MRIDFFKIFFLLFPEDDDFTVLFWSASSDRPCVMHFLKNGEGDEELLNGWLSPLI
jgi:hypothetical protein